MIMVNINGGLVALFLTHINLNLYIDCIPRLQSRCVLDDSILISLFKYTPLHFLSQNDTNISFPWMQA